MAGGRKSKAAPAMAIKEFYSVAELAAANLPGLPRDASAIDRLARASWRANQLLARRVPGKTKPVWEYHYSLLPHVAQTRLLTVHMAPANDDRDITQEKRGQLWHAFETLSKDQKAVCEDRLKALQMTEDLERSGLTAKAAVAMACRRISSAVLVSSSS